MVDVVAQSSTRATLRLQCEGHSSATAQLLILIHLKMSQKPAWHQAASRLKSEVVILIEITSARFSAWQRLIACGIVGRNKHYFMV